MTQTTKQITVTKNKGNGPAWDNITMPFGSHSLFYFTAEYSLAMSNDQKKWLYSFCVHFFFE